MRVEGGHRAGEPLHATAARGMQKGLAEDPGGSRLESVRIEGELQRVRWREHSVRADGPLGCAHTALLCAVISREGTVGLEPTTHLLPRDVVTCGRMSSTNTVEVWLRHPWFMPP